MSAADVELTSPVTKMVERVGALRAAIELAQGRLGEADLVAAGFLADRSLERLRHGTEHTVIAIAGATGSGKSTIVNRLAGEELSDASVRRPTTAVTHAVVWGDADAGPLLDWLEVRRRFRTEADPELSGLVLLDLPDHDSTAVEHRLEVDRLVGLVDVLVWVTDPQKYADEALHVGYIQPLRHHAAVLRFVLNQIDLVADAGASIATDLHRLLEDDGVADPTVYSVSARTGAGFDELRAMLAEAIAERRAVVARIDADLVEAADTMRRGRAIEEGRATDRMLRGDTADELRRGLAEAAGAHETAAVASNHHRRRGSLTMGWPFTRWARRLRRKPLADLPGPGRTASSAPRADLAIRDYAEVVSADLEAPWPSAVRRAATDQRDELLDDLRTVVGRAAVGAGVSPRWWSLVAWLQRIFAVTAVVGLGWLLTVAVLGGFFRFDTEPLLPPTPEADWMPLPSALLIGGVLLGLLLAFFTRFPLGVGAARRGRAARTEVEAAVDDSMVLRVIEPVEHLIAEHRRLDDLLDVVAGT